MITFLRPVRAFSPFRMMYRAALPEEARSTCLAPKYSPQSLLQVALRILPCDPRDAVRKLPQRDRGRRGGNALAALMGCSR
jgi:hypothetical protein